MSNITKNMENLSLSSHGTHAGISSQVDGAKNGSPIPNPVTTVPNHDNMSPSHRPSSSTDIPENIFIHKPTSTYMNGNIPSPTFMGNVNHSHSKPYPIPFSGQSNIPCAPFQHYLDPRMYPLSYNPIIMNNSSTQPLSASTSTNDANAATTSNLSNVNNFTVDHKLRYISQPSDFPEWIRTFADYLRSNDLSHFIPTSATTPLILSPTDKDYLVTLFTHYVTTTAYPEWFAQKLTKSYFTLAQAITLALFKYGRAKTGYEYAHDLSTITFNPDTEVYDFRLQIHYHKEQCSIHGITVDDRQIIKSIISNLPSGYEQVGINYRCNPTTFTLTHILDYIAATQEQINNNQRTITPIPTSSPIYCQLCSKPGHSAPSCPEFDITPKSKKPSSTSKPRSKSSTKASTSNDFTFKSPTLKKVTITKSYTPTESLRYPSASSTTVTTKTHHREYNPSSNLDDYFIIDTGADISIVNTEDYLHNPHNTNRYRLSMANSTSIPILSKGRLHFQWSNGITTTLPALLSPTCSYNLISGYDLRQVGIHLDSTRLCLTNSKGTYLCPIHLIGHNFCVSKKYLLPTHHYTVKAVQSHPKHSLQFIHNLFGHINIHYIKKSLQDKTITGLTHDSVDWTDINKFQCPICMKGKTRKHSHIVGHRTKYQQDYAPFEYIHSDIFGPLPNLPPSAPKYFISFIDENTRFRWVYPLNSKDSATVTPIFYNFIKMIKTQFNVRIKCFQLDRGSEYTNDVVRSIFHKAGILPSYTSTSDSASHGVAESSNLTFLNDCRTLLASSGLPDKLWFEAVAFATLLRNSIINSTTKMSPRGKAGLCGIDASTILPFGHRVVIFKHKTFSKLDERGVDGIALRPSDESNGYRIYIPSTHSIIDTANYGTYKFTEPATPSSSNRNVFDSFFDTINTPTTEESSTSSSPLSTNPSVSLPSSTSSTSPTQSSSPSKRSEPSSSSSSSLSSSHPPTSPSPSSSTSHDSIKGGTTHQHSPSKPTITTGKSLRRPHKNTSFSQQPQPKRYKKSTSSSSTKLINGDIDPSNILHGARDRNYVSTRSQLRSSNTTTTPTSSSSHHTISGGISSSDQPINTTSSHSNNMEMNDESLPKQNVVVRYLKAVDTATNESTIDDIADMNHSRNYQQAISKNKNEQEKKLFQEAYKKEISQLEKLNTWDSSKLYNVQDIPKSRIINTMFIFNTKRNGQKKCRLVARGDLQLPDTYNKNSKANTIHHQALMICLKVALEEEMFITQLDISSAYLYADLKDELYIRTLPHMRQPGKLMMLKKSLYGLKQSGANWYNKIKGFLLDHCNLNEVENWQCVFINKDIIVCLFVDDMIVLSKKLVAAQDFIDTLKSTFETKIVNDVTLKDGKACYDILGLTVNYKYGKELSFNMTSILEEKIPKLGCSIKKTNKTIRLPCSKDFNPNKEDLELDKDTYQREIKWLQKITGFVSYVATKYRFELLYYVNILAQHTLYPSTEIKKLATKLLQYIWDTRKKELIWKKSGNSIGQLVTLTDAAFANSMEFKSQLGYFIIFNGDIIAGKSTTPSLTCISSTEAELCAINTSYPVLIRIQCLLNQIYRNKLDVCIITDSKNAIQNIKEGKEIDYRNIFYGSKAYRLREEIKKYNIKIQYINTKFNKADMLTKPLDLKRFNALTEMRISEIDDLESQGTQF